MKNRLNKIVVLILTVFVVLSSLGLSAFAVADKDIAQISVSVSSSSPQKGDTIKVTVQIDNYATMTPKISAMEVSVQFDSNVFSLVPGTVSTSSLKINSGDAIGAVYDGDKTVDFYYCYANNSGQPLPRGNINKFILFTFDLKVSEEIQEDTSVAFEVTKCNLYDSHMTSTPGSEIRCKEPKLPSVKVYVDRPAVLYNESGVNEGTYDKMVKLEFDASTAELSYEGRDAVTITSPHFLKENGTYELKVKADGTTVNETITVDREIKSISLKVGTYTTKYALNEDLNLEKGEIIVQYYDDSPYSEDNGISYIPLSDSNISVSGYDKTVPGEQKLNVIYMGFTTSMSVTVMEVSVAGIIVKSGSELAYKYVPVGYPIDTTGLYLIVQYSDGTKEEKNVDASMLGEYLNAEAGVVSVDIKVGDKVLEDAFEVEYVAADELTAFKNDVKSTDPDDLVLNDVSKVEDMISRYNALVSRFGPSVMTNGVDVQSQYDAIVQKMSDITGGEMTPGLNTGDSETGDVTNGDDTTGTPDTQRNNGNTMKVIGIVIAVIVALSVVAGVVYFIVVYLKKKKEAEEYYYDDDEDEDDDDDDDMGLEQPTVSASFDYLSDDIIGINFEEDEDDE